MTDPQTPNSFNRTLANIEQTMKAREAAKIYQFPMWPEPERGFPNEVIRSALFAAIQGRGRRYLDNQQIACQDGYTITFTGQTLDQTHLDVFEGIMHIARGTHEGNQVQFSAHRLLKLIGRHTGKSQHQWLQRALQHLTATSVAISRDEQRVFWGSLLPRGAADLQTGTYVIQISRDLIKLFDRGFTQVDWQQRRQLRGKPLAQWLHLYYSSHAKPYPVTVEFLRKKSGGATASMRAFRQNLKTALEELKATGIIAAWHLDDSGLLHVNRIPSTTQQRFLSRTPELS